MPMINKCHRYFNFLSAMAFCTQLWMFAILVLSVLGQIKQIEPLTMLETWLVLWIWRFPEIGVPLVIIHFSGILHEIK